MNKRLVSIIIGCAMLSGMAAGCSKMKSGDVTKLTWYIPGVYDGNDYQKVMQQVNEKLRNKYNLELDLIAFDAGNYASKMETMHAAGEVYDLAFTSNWTNSFFKNVENGVLLDISELLPQYAPTLYEDTNKDVLKAVTVDGAVYAIPNWQMQASGTGVVIPKDKLDKTGMTLDDINSVEDFTSYFEKIHVIEPRTNRIGGYWNYLMPYYGLLGVNTQGLPGAVYYEKNGKPVVVNQYETDEFKKYTETVRNWVKEGLAIDVYAPDYNAGKAEIQESPGGFVGYKPGLAAEHSKNMGFEYVAKQISPQIMSTSGVTAALTSVAATSKHPEEAVRILEIMHTDSEIMNLLCWGIEGKHYDKINDCQIKFKQNSGYSGIPTFYLGSMANAYILDTQPKTTIEDTKNFNDLAVVSPVMGFNPILDNISVETANCQSVIDEQLEYLQLGLIDENGLNKFISDLKAAGSDKIIEELQKQIDKWWGEK